MLGRSTVMRIFGKLVRIGAVICLLCLGWIDPAAQAQTIPDPPTNLRFISGIPICEHGCGLNAGCVNDECVCAPGATGDPEVVCEWPSCPASCDVVAGCAPDGSCNDCPAGYEPDGADCTPRYAQHLRQFDLSNDRHLQYYGNHALDVGSEDVVRAVFVIHGSDRNADDYYERMWEAAALARAQHRTVIIAPWFRIDSDEPDPGEVFWESNSDWKRGDRSETPKLSSFRVLDEMLDVMHARVLFPNLRQIIVTGHSAGGQYAQRFSLASPTTSPPDMLPTLYAPANPSSYAYLNDERPLGDGSFDRPTDCSSYNKWKYGLDSPNAYLAQASPDELREEYRERRVVYLLGQDDDDPESPLLDVTCSAMHQGDHRLQRGLRFYDYLEYYYSSTVHELLVIEGVGHSSTSMFRSPAARELFFGD